MDRAIVYSSEQGRSTDFLFGQRSALVGLAKLAEAVLGTGTLVNGLTVTQTTVPSMAVLVAPGQVYELAQLDATAYGALAADTTHNIVKQGLLLDAATLAIAAPGTAGYSTNYLIQATYQDSDTTPVVLPYYNSANPSQPLTGQNNSGAAQATERQGVCLVSAKAGAAATTGTQTTPSPDSGYVGRYVVTVAYGASTVINSNISAYSAAPFLPSAGLVVGGLQGNACNISIAGGTADALTGTFNPAITMLTNGMTLSVRATTPNQTTTPTFTPTVGVIPAKTIVKGAGSAVAIGDIAGAGHWVDFQYDATLDKWVLLNPATGISPASASIQGAFKNLQASATGLSANISVTADEIVVENSSNAYQTLRGVNLTISGASSGVANGLDTGTFATSAWYSVWIIWNGTTISGLLSLSATAPTLPSGYTHKARVGWIRTDGTANKYPLSFIQIGRNVSYKVASGSNVPNLLVATSGAVGSVSNPTWGAVSMVAYVPPTASAVLIVLAVPATGTAMVAPNNAYGVYNSTANPPPIMISAAAGIQFNFSHNLLLESTNIYWASSAGEIAIAGWTDNI